MNKLSKEKRDKILLIAACTAVLAGAIWYFVIGAQKASLARQREASLDLQDRVDRAEIRIRRKSLLEAELNELNQGISAIEAQMVPPQQLKGKLWILDILEKFIKDKSAIRLLRLSNEPVQDKRYLMIPNLPYSGAAWNVELQAHYHDFGQFLADFENQFPYLRIHRLELWPLYTPSAAPGATPDLDVQAMNEELKEKLSISMTVVALFKPPETP